MKLKIDMGSLGTIEMEGEDPKRLITDAAFFQSLPSLCGFEGCGLSLRFQARPTSKGIYYELICNNDPAHTKQIHQKKPENGGGLYVIPNEKFEVEYNARQGGGDDAPEGWNEHSRNQPQGNQPQGQAQGSQPTTDQRGRQTSAPAEKVDVNDKYARMVATSGFVRKEGESANTCYLVDIGQDTFTIAYNDNKKAWFCTCERQGCVHLQAAKIWAEMEKAKTEPKL